MTEPKEAQADHVLIKRGLYYRPDGAGYTALKCEAGLYPEGYADTLEGVSAVPFADADEFAPAAWEETKVDYYKKQAASLTAENAALREKLAEARDALLRKRHDCLLQFVTQLAHAPRKPCTWMQIREAASDLLTQIDALTGGDNAEG